MKNFFKDKFAYNFESNNKIIELISKNPNAYTNNVKTLIGHTFNAQHIWNSRILKVPLEVGVWDIFDISELYKLNSDYNSKSNEIIEELDLDQVIKYKNMNGQQFSKKLDTILFHVINHSTYHRGQIIRELKLEGVSPIDTDFILFKQ